MAEEPVKPNKTAEAPPSAAVKTMVKADLEIAQEVPKPTPVTSLSAGANEVIDDL